MKRRFIPRWTAILLCACSLASLAAPGSLPEPATLGRIVDAQGLVSIRPLNADRWTPVTGELAVLPGDWLRTDNRGANAVRVRLANGGSVILGPNAQVEFADSATLRISRGELEIAPARKAPLTAGLPGDAAGKLQTPLTCRDTTLVRVKDGALTRLDQEPSWLQGFKGSVVRESMGELLVNVDGRDVALTVGYHKVTIDIRDQIVRTVIEESFVNHTNSQLEGVFHFPLPADASISDFGMWIGDELVKADVVEKQRAREIYETILRERRDPGLLEWTGGNIFKARVFPIFPHSEKRVTITYTQVLPLRNGVCRYSYPLQSEMLRQKPLRELQVTVNLYSAVPLKGVRCPSHEARIRQTANAASIEYAAQESTPDKDFELLFEPDVEKQPLAVIPHQRGTDGYFLLLLTPPAERAARPLLFGGEPLRLIILADTSGSMDPKQRAAQVAFLSALLSSLRGSDRFLLGACDVDCSWLTPEFTRPGDAEIATALDALAARRSMGWTDLGRSLAAAAAKADGKCQLVYLGDGIPATAEIDPVAFAKRVPELLAPAVAKGLSAHAVATGSAYEAPVMKALAAQGGGSFRRLDGDGGPIKAARELLEELTRPPVRDLALTVKGLKAAKVYPQELPNLPAGQQQVMVGLYQPSSLAPDASVRVTGKLGDKLIAYEQPLRLPKARKAEQPAASRGAAPTTPAGGEPPPAPGTALAPPAAKPAAGAGPSGVAPRPPAQAPRNGAGETATAAEDEGAGNSFIPRLWARLHLDVLLEQDPTPEVREQIVGFSQEYRIMTPYTSFLVLESDADRERFGVKRHFAMRDGEAFFAEGREKGNYQLVQAQVKAAAGWRAGLRRQALAELADLGRSLQLLPEADTGISIACGSPTAVDLYYSRLGIGSGGMAGPVSGLTRLTLNGLEAAADYRSNTRSDVSYKLGGDVDFDGAAGPLPENAPADIGAADEKKTASSEDASKNEAEAGEQERIGAKDKEARLAEADDDGSIAEEPPATEILELAQAKRPMPDASSPAKPMVVKMLDAEVLRRITAVRSSEEKPLPLGGFYASRTREMRARQLAQAQSMSFKRGWSDSYAHVTDGFQWLTAWLPYLHVPAALSEPTIPSRTPVQWTNEAFQLALTLDRRPALTAAKTTLRIVQTERSSRSGLPDGEPAQNAWVRVIGPSGWLEVSFGDSLLSNLSWQTPAKVGAVNLPYAVGRTGIPAPGSIRTYRLDVPGESSAEDITNRYTDLHWEARPVGAERAELVALIPGSKCVSRRLLIDTARHVQLEDRRYACTGAVATLSKTTRFLDFSEAAGCWWPTRIERLDADGKVTSTTTLTVKALTAPQADAAWAVIRQIADESLLVPTPLPGVTAAKRADADGKATAPDLMALVSHFAASAQWDRAAEFLTTLRGQLKDKPGFRFLEFGFQAQARRNEELRQGLLAAARDLVARGIDNRAWEKLLPAGALPERCGELAFARVLLDHANTFQANEILELLDLLKPVFARQPARLDAMTDWLQRRTNALRNAGQPDAALAIEAGLVRTRPWDGNLLTQYAQNLANTGAYDKAIALLEAALAKPHPNWPDHMLNKIRQTLLNQYGNAGLYERQIPVYEAAANSPKSPADHWFYQQYLSALLRAGREGEAKKHASEWFVPVQASLATPTPAEMARASAAVQYMTGNIDGSYRHGGDVETEWLVPLAKLVRDSAGNARFLDLASGVMASGQFSGTDTARALRAEFAAKLTGDISGFDLRQLQTFVGWVSVNAPAVETDTWRAIAANLEKRWRAALAALTPEDKANAWSPAMRPLAELGSLVATTLQSHVSAGEYLRFVRRQMAEGPALHRDAYTQELFNALLAQTWNVEYEEDAFDLLCQFLPDAKPVERLPLQAQALLLLDDWRLAGRQGAVAEAYTTGKPLPTGAGDGERLKAVPAKPLHELTRSEQKKLAVLARDLSRESVADRLATELKRAPAELRPWLTIERLDLLTRLGRPAVSLAPELLELLGPQPPRDFAAPLDQALFLRTLTLAQALAAREAAAAAKPAAKPSPAAIIEPLLKYCRAGLAAAAEHEAGRDFWREQLYRLLLIADRPAELEAELRAWLKTADGFSPWRVTLAYLLAETDRLREAAATLENVDKANDLDAGTWRTLAGWYLALDDKAKHQAAKLKALEASAENTLSNRVNAERNKLARNDYDGGEGGLPASLDPEVVDVLTVLLRKTTYPGNYSWYVQELYRNSRDFRLLRSVAEAMVGHTAQQVYPFLQGMRNLLQEIRDEATADQLAAAIAEVRKRATTPVDRRALYLVEADVKRRASEVLNQPGQHVPAALAALQAAFREKWEKGEPRLVAEYLYNLGRITQRPLADEQLRQLKELCSRLDETPIDRLYIASFYSQVLWNDGNHTEPFDILTRAIDTYRATTGDVLTSDANHPCEVLLSWCRQVKDFRRGEALLRRELAKPANPGQREWLVQQLFTFYVEALIQEGDTAIGRGEPLYTGIRTEILRELARADARAQGIHGLVDTFCRLLTRATQEKKMPGTADHIRAFAKETVPGLLPRLSREPYTYRNTVSNVAQALHTIAGARDALAFLLTCSDNEPAWFATQGYAFWDQHAGQLGEWRGQIPDLGDLEPRLLAVVLRAQREDLLGQRGRSRYIYSHHSSYFWEAKAQLFADAAVDAARQKSDSSGSLTHITAYLYNDLDLYDKAIEILADAWQRNVLDEQGQAQLANYLQNRERWAESLPVLGKLVKLRPDNVQYRCQTIAGLAKCGKPAEARAAFTAAVAHFKARQIWQEGNIGALAFACVTAELWAEAVATFDEVIALHRRTVRMPAQGDGTLSQYYANLARAHASLGNTAAAVDAAAGAIISWGRNLNNRHSAVSSLTQVLQQSKDLNAYVAQLDAQTLKSGLDNPIVRKALGQVYAQRGAREQAVVQLRLAVQGQPNDAETHQQLVATLDAMNKRADALAALLDQAVLMPRDLQVRRQIYERLAALQQPAEAERAATGIVEAAPTEAENHRALAELRQQQNRWEHAAPHWQRVSELRALEPTGLLGLARAQLQLKRHAEVKATVTKLLGRPWPQRFGNVKEQAEQLLRQTDGQ